MSNTEEQDLEEKEVVPNIEIKLSKEKRMECRQIVQEIRNFRVSQRQILYLVELLALELENRETMTAVLEAVKQNREKVTVNVIQLTDEAAPSKLIF